jgi:predicted phosphodiesterase
MLKVGKEALLGEMYMKSTSNRSMKKRKIVLKLAGLIFIVGALLIFSLEAYILYMHKDTKAPIPPLFGNFTSIRTKLTEAPPKEEFSFAVFGDTKGVSGTFELLADRFRGTSIDLGFLLGDAFWGDTYGFFRAELAEEYRLPFPTIFVAGNHDIETLPVAEFESTFGPTLFSFEYQHCLFVVLRVVGDVTDQESVDFVKALLQQDREKYRRVFVFMHIPPPVLDLPKFTAPQEFIELFHQLQADYVFAGHYHGYAHTVLRDTTYLVTAGAGGDLDESSYGQFKHGMVITVGNDYIRETIVPLEAHYSDDGLERFLLVDAYVWLQENDGLVYGINIALGVVSLLVILFVFRKNSCTETL